MVPGYGAPQLFISNSAPTSFPTTYDQKRSCDQVVATSNLVDVANSTYVYARVYIWKDYNDTLFITVSMNATGFGPGASPPATNNPGQYLFAEPSLFNPTKPSGTIYVWGDYLGGLPPNYDTYNLLSPVTFGQWSCFTLRVDLKLTCNPRTSQYSKTARGCIYTTTRGPSTDTADLSSSANLFLSVKFNLTRFRLDGNTTPGLSGPGYCGSYGGKSHIEPPILHPCKV